MRRWTAVPFRAASRFRGKGSSEGGVLIIGPEDAQPHKITGCQKVGSESPSDWAQKALLGMP